MSAFWLEPLVMTLCVLMKLILIVTEFLNVSCLLDLLAVGLPLMLTRNSYHVLLTTLILCPLLLECSP
jgi:hypothetical protein